MTFATGDDVIHRRAVQYRYEGDIFSGEKRMDLLVAPALSVNISPEVAIIPTASVRPAATTSTVSPQNFAIASCSACCTDNPLGCHCQPTNGRPSYSSVRRQRVIASRAGQGHGRRRWQHAAGKLRQPAQEGVTRLGGTTGALQAGLLVNRTAERVVRMLPPLNVTAAEIDEAATILDAVLASVAAAGAENLADALKR